MDARTDLREWGVAGEPSTHAVLRNSEKPLWNKSRTRITSTIRYGDIVAVLKHDVQWVLVQSTHDNYIGWVDRPVLEAVPDHSAVRVTVRSTHIYPEPDLKTPPVKSVGMGARLCAFETNGDFTRVDEGFVFTAHIASQANEPADWARDLLGTPYLWGGGTATGIDCSGLTQICHAMNGVEIPRDTDQQEANLTEIDFDDRVKNDLVFWPGHVGILADRDTLIHATAFKMSTIIEPLAEAINRIGAPSSIRRAI